MSLSAALRLVAVLFAGSVLQQEAGSTEVAPLLADIANVPSLLQGPLAQRVVDVASSGGGLGRALVEAVQQNAMALMFTSLSESEFYASASLSGLEPCNLAYVALQAGSSWPAVPWEEAVDLMTTPGGSHAGDRCKGGRLLAIGSRAVPNLDTFLLVYTPLLWVLDGISLLRLGAGALEVLSGATGLLTREGAVREVLLEADAEPGAVQQLELHGFRCEEVGQEARLCSAPLQPGASDTHIPDVNTAWHLASDRVAQFRDSAQDNSELAEALRSVAVLFQAARELDHSSQMQVASMARSLSVNLVMSNFPSASMTPRCTLEAMISAGTLLLPACLQEQKCATRRWADAARYFRRAGLHTEVEALHAALPDTVRQQLCTSTWQPCETCVPGVRSAPVWYAEGESSGDPDIDRLVRTLEANVDGIRSDLRRILTRRNSWPASYPGIEVVSPAQERNWSKVMLYDGDNTDNEPVKGIEYPRRRLHPGLCEDFAPFTCRLLEEERLLPGIAHGDKLPYLQYDHEQVNFFRMRPGTRVQYHAAHQNLRLTLHLCLAGCGHPGTFIKVGEHRLNWPAGRAIVFDDSYLHRVRVDANNPGDRWVLHIMFMHPEVNAPEKYRRVIGDQKF